MRVVVGGKVGGVRTGGGRTSIDLKLPCSPGHPWQLGYSSSGFRVYLSAQRAFLGFVTLPSPDLNKRAVRRGIPEREQPPSHASVHASQQAHAHVCSQVFPTETRDNRGTLESLSDWRTREV